MDKTTTVTTPGPKLPVQSSSNSAGLPKIAPKPTLIKSTTTAGKIVYIKSPNGTPQPIRIGSQIVNSANTTSTANASSASGGGIQLIKTVDGNILQIKNKQVVSVQKQSASPAPTSTSTAASANSTRFVLKSGTGSRVVLATPPTSKTAVTSTGGNTRTLTVTQAQQMGLITQANLKEFVSAANTNKSTVVTTNTKQSKVGVSAVSVATNRIPAANVVAVAPKGQPTILNKSLKPTAQPQKIVIQSSSTAGISAKPKVAPVPTHNVVKLGQSTQLRAVNVAGKGVQYVRVFSSNAGSTANSTTAAKVTTANGRQTPMYVRKVVPPSQVQPTNQQRLSNAQNTSQFVTKLEVTPVATTGGGLQAKSFKKDPVSAGQSKGAPVLLNTSGSKVNILNDARTGAAIKMHSGSYEITPGSRNYALKSPATSPTASPQKVIYRSYKLSEEQKPKSPNNQQPQSTTLYSNLKLPSPEPLEGIRRKHCNCTKSQCLKLYCDCFANGEFCSNCNCKECFNTLEREDERQKAIKICLERNPHAFKPKIGKSRDQSDALRRHTKGCNCKRSGCLKNYCECYEAKIVCSGNCKCIGCRNIDDSFDHPHDREPYENSHVKRSYDQRDDPSSKLSSQGSLVPVKRACNFITSDVIEATIQCVIAQADDCQKNNYDARTSERKILEEFGRCLVEIIDFSKKNNENNGED